MPTPHRPLPRRILVVDDEPLLRRMLVRVLEAYGSTVLTAGDGLAAMAVLEDETVDVVLSDQVMPRCDGRELLLRLRCAGRQLPVIILTGYAEESDHALRAAGATLVLGKPCSVPQLLEALACCVGMGASTE